MKYTAGKKKTYKHNGYTYEFSLYALLWKDDCYYALGYSKKHNSIAKFRVDRMAHPDSLVAEYRKVLLSALDDDE